MPRTRFSELVALADEHDGLLTAAEAAKIGIASSVLARLTKRGRLDRVARGVYRIPYSRPGPLSQYQEAVLWAQSSHGPERVALSHDTAFAVYGITDANPPSVHITVPKAARLRRRRPKWVTVHRGELKTGDVLVHEGLPLTTIEKTVIDVLTTTGTIEHVRQAIAEARREGFLNAVEAQRLRQRVAGYLRHLAATGRSNTRGSVA